MSGDQLIYLFLFIIVQVKPMIEVIKLWLDVSGYWTTRLLAVVIGEVWWRAERDRLFSVVSHSILLYAPIDWHPKKNLFSCSSLLRNPNWLVHRGLRLCSVNWSYKPEIQIFRSLIIEELRMTFPRMSRARYVLSSTQDDILCLVSCGLSCNVCLGKSTMRLQFGK
jgi:hypothetical protein